MAGDLAVFLATVLAAVTVAVWEMRWERVRVVGDGAGGLWGTAGVLFGCCVGCAVSFSVFFFFFLVFGETAFPIAFMEGESCALGMEVPFCGLVDRVVDERRVCRVLPGVMTLAAMC